MRVLVTGGAGFLGSHVVETLLSEGHLPIVLDDLSTGSPANLPPGFPVHRHDIVQSPDPLFERERPDVVIHLAAQVSVPQSVADPVRDAAVNVIGTVNVMRAAARCGCQKVIYLSSAAVYGIPQHLPLTEEMVGEPLAPYALSKYTAEGYVRLLGQLSGLAYTILRPANIYGPRQRTTGEGAVIPAFLQAFLEKRDPVIHGDGSQVRDFVFVKDMASAIVMAIPEGNGYTLNISSGQGVSILDLWHHLAPHFSWKRPVVHGPSRPGDIHQSVLANDRARQALGWVPRVDLTEGLKVTVDHALALQVAATREQ